MSRLYVRQLSIFFVLPLFLSLSLLSVCLCLLASRCGIKWLPSACYGIVAVIVCGPINFLDRAINMFLFRRFDLLLLVFMAVVAVIARHVVAGQFVLSSCDVSDVCGPPASFGYAISCIIIAN